MKQLSGVASGKSKSTLDIWKETAQLNVGILYHIGHLMKGILNYVELLLQKMILRMLKIANNA